MEISKQKKEEENAADNVTEISIEDDVVKKFYSQCFSSYRETGFCLVQPYNQVLPIGYKKYHHARIQNFEAFEDDVWICTFPKSGRIYALFRSQFSGSTKTVPLNQSYN